MIVNLFVSILLLITFMAFAAKRLLTYLHAYQQEEYDSPRFAGWVAANKVFDKRLSIILLLLGAGWLFLYDFKIFADLAALGALAYTAYKEKDPRIESKKKLAMTSRAKRIYFIALPLCGLSGLVVFLTHSPWIWVLCVQLIPLFLMLGNALLQPYEKIVQKKFWNEAHKKLLDLNPTVIGVTGSFGKTSVKHILGHILQNVAPTLATPGSVNTPMGITRIIREQLDETHKYFIVEMGAYGPGSIKRLCALAPPKHGIITAIGHAHYERFKTLDSVAQAKFELADSVVNNDGKVITYETTVKFPYSKDFLHQNLLSTTVCGEGEKASVKIENIRQTLRGLEIRLHWNDKTHLLEAPLFGLHHGENIVMAFVMAATLGIEPAVIINALKTTPQIPHRLQVLPRGENSGIIIDDAFNSNPRGFNSALALIADIGRKKRKILVTPGMVELGKAHNEIHKQIGLHAAQTCDIVIAIQPKRIASFISAFKEEARADQQIMEMDTFAEAQSWINDNIGPDDIILIENDLPDVYERLPKL